MEAEIKAFRKRMAWFLGALAIMLYFLVVLLILNGGLSFNYWASLIIFSVLLFLCIRYRKKILAFVKRHKIGVRAFMILLIVVGFLSRFAFLLFQGSFHIELTLSDTGVHWYGAQQIIESGGLDQEIGEYERLYPYLFSYTGVLSAFMSIFGKAYWSILLFNVICDVISCALLYILFYSWKKNKSVGLLAATLWAISPLQIVFCGLPLAIVVVNMLLVASVTMIYFSVYCRNKKIKLTVFPLLAGCVIAVGNAFRPIFIVLLIAYLIYCFLYTLKQKSNLRGLLISCAMMALGYLIASTVPGFLHRQFNSYYHGEKGRVGWSVFVGANYETMGVWSSDDSRYFFGNVLGEQAGGDVDIASSMIFNEAIERYKEMLLNWQIVPHFMNKTSVLFADVKNSIHDLPRTFNFSKKNGLYMVLQDLILVYYYCVVCVIGWCIVSRIKRGRYGLLNDSFEKFLTIVVLGLFAASMLVEVMNRYILPFIVILLILAVGLLYRDRKNTV